MTGPIVGLAFRHLVLEHDDDSWRMALGRIGNTVATVVRLTTADGCVGFGSVPIGAELISGESHASVENFLRAAGPALVGADPLNRQQLMDRVNRTMAGNRRAKAGIDAALHDLAGRMLDQPVATLLGGAVRRSVAVLRLVPAAAPDAAADRAAALVAQGFGYLKIKLDGDRAGDVDRVAAIRAAVGPTPRLVVDANQSYRVPGAVALLRQLEAYDVDLAEQPVAADDVEGLAAVRSRSPIPIEADESIRTLGDALRLIRLGAVDYLSIKIGHLGGIDRARKVASLCEAASIGCLVGANTGGRLADAAYLHFIAATPAVSYACEVGEFARITHDPTGELECVDGELRLPTGAGLGVRPDPALDFVELGSG